MSEGTDASAPASETEEPESISPPSGKGKRPWLMIAAIVVAILLVATAVYVIVPTGSKKLTATIKGTDPLVVDAGATQTFTVIVKWGNKDVTNETSTTFLWSVTPVNLGLFSLKAKYQVPFVAGVEGGNGTVKCVVKYKTQEVSVTKALTVTPPYLDSVSVTPPTKTIVPDGNYTFRAAAISSVGLVISGITFTWEITGDPSVIYALNRTTGPSVLVSVGNVTGNLTLSATGSYGGKTKTGYSNITVGLLPPRSVDFLWYDMFNVPIGPWYYKRWDVYKQEEPISTSYPWIFYYHDSPPGNTYTYSLMRLNITGRNVSQISMNDKPEFLPILSPTERGGTAVIDWYMQYLTYDELTKYGPTIANQDDGWIVDLNGTVLLDKQAAKTVLNVTDIGFSNFADWWSGHGSAFQAAYTEWLVNEAEGRVDIENAYESYYQLFNIKIDAVKVGDKILLTYDILTWGMETLMLRWFHEVLMPIEMWYEDLHFHMTIMPEFAKVDVDTAVTYALYATESHNKTGPKGDPSWTFQPLLGDAQPSSIQHPISEFDKYMNYFYTNMEVGAPLYGQLMPWDNVPAAWNLTENETLTFEWPSGNQLFRYGVKPGLAINVTDEMTVDYAEPMWTDMPDQVIVNYTTNTVEYIGPIDMWDWSRNQTESTHPHLLEEWNRLNMLPYGQPWVEFKKKTPVRLYLDHFDISTAASVPANDYLTVTVTAIDNYGNTYYDYAGEVNFTSSTDSLASFTANYTYDPLTDAGVHTFVGGVQFETTGAQTLTVLNVSAAPQKHGDVNVQVLPKREAHFTAVDVYHLPSVGNPEDVTVTVFDQYGDVFLNYTGTVTFTSNKTADVTMPADYPFQLSDEGVREFAAGLNFTAEGWFNVTVSDLADSSVTGSNTNILVEPSPEVIDHFNVSGIRNMLAKQKSDVTVVAYDQYGFVFERYVGTIHFTSSPAGGVFPADYTFTLNDMGVKTFKKAVMFTPTADTVFSVTVADTVTTSAIGTQSNIVILYKPPKETFTMYDMFKQPWGEWWPWRYTGYSTDILLTNESGKYTFIYNADKLGNQGIIYAPYRWNMTGSNMTQVSINNPEFMPVLGKPNVPGASATVKIYFEYLSHSWWNSYWSPVWHFPDSIMDSQTRDGYYPGTTYNITMNRAAAEEWLGMPQTAAPATWWALNGANYTAAWEAWILNEGNVRLDIYNGYEYPYVDLATKMKLSVLPSGDIYLQIGHLGEGYEILMTRWMNETALCNHEPYYEDMSFNIKYYSDWIDFNFDAVCQYSLHAVKANQSATNEGAWAWEPQLIDYVDSSNGHPSKYDLWYLRTYQSWNAGDPKFGRQVGYDSGLQYFNLTDYQTFVIKIPTGDNHLGFLAQPVPGDAIYRILTTSGKRMPPDPNYDPYPSGDGTRYNYTAYWPLMYNGSMSLGWVGNWSGNPDLHAPSVYNAATNIVTMVGPMYFDNTHLVNGALYRGAPWIEFNVSVPVGGTSIPTPASPTAPAKVSLSAELMSLSAVIAATMMAVIVLAASARRRT